MATAVVRVVLVVSRMMRVRTPPVWASWVVGTADLG